MPSVTETCDECAFDGERWNDQDVLTTLPIIGALWREYLCGAEDELLQRRAAVDRWSIAEYTDHLREVLWAMRFLVDTVVSAPGADMGPAPEPRFDAQARTIDVLRAVERLDDEGRSLADVLGAIDPGEWSAGVIVDGARVDLRWIGRHAVHDATHHLHDIGRIRALLGDGVGHQLGRVTDMHVSPGGVPKRPVDRVAVGFAGLHGDAQHDRRNHGRPFQALSFWAGEVIDALAAEGHPIGPGLTGENVTIRGVEWSSLRPGTIVCIGEVRAELSSYATPCAKNAKWFLDGDFGRMDQDRHPGWSRMYARVLQPGVVRVGDPVEVEPA